MNMYSHKFYMHVRFFFFNKKNGLMRVIIDPIHLNPLLMTWDTPGYNIFAKRTTQTRQLLNSQM